MRTHTLKTTVLSFIVASALMVPISASAKQESQPAPTQSTVNAGKSVNGKLTAKSETSLTVDSTQIALTTTTSFTKNGASIKLDDINVGDELRVTVTEAPGEPQALAVEVVTIK